MSASTTKQEFRRGLRDGAPFILGAVPFGVVFGVAATEAGLKLVEVMSMTVLVFAGAAQIAALAQMQDAAPALLAVAAGLIVNLRMAMYSASLAPHLGEAPLWQRALAGYLLVDNAYAVAIVDFENRPARPASHKMAYFVGSALPVWFLWCAACFVGAVFGKTIPAQFPADFAVPIVFLAIVTPLFRSLAHVAAGVTSVVAALALSFLPYSLGLFIAAGLAMLVGAEVDRRMGRTT